MPDLRLSQSFCHDTIGPILDADLIEFLRNEFEDTLGRTDCAFRSRCARHAEMIVFADPTGNPMALFEGLQM
jgi:hypothetical protein